MLLLPHLYRQVIMQKLSEVEQYKAAVLQYADQIMETLLRVFGNHSSSVHEEAMLAVGAFTYACGRRFSNYLTAIYPYIKMGLMNHQEWQVRSGCLRQVWELEQQWL
jgi:importin subunit beta-1